MGIASPRVTITRIQITSYGGVDEAMRELVLAVAVLGPIPIEVPRACHSACIGFLAQTEGPKHIAPSAALMFHTGSTTTTPHLTDPLCLCWISLDSLFNMFGGGNKRVMLQWAATLTDQLPILFDLCPIHPLDTSTGMILSGRELNDLRDGLIQAHDLTFKCPPNRS